MNTPGDSGTSFKLLCYGEMPTTRKCWIDDGTSPVYQAWVGEIKDSGAKLLVGDGKTLPATFTVYFDEHFYVGRTSTVQSHDGEAYAVLFPGRTPPRSQEPPRR
jgi:hypothetical protein